MSTGEWKHKRKEIKRASHAVLDLGLEIDAIDFKPDGTFTVRPKQPTAKPEKQPADAHKDDWSDER
jgi:hypothetical protein